MEEKVLQAQRPKVTIPKPKALVGGSEVYQKDGLPYWYCKIKGGRDEFMHLYMEDLSLNDLFYDPMTGRKIAFTTRKQKEFKQNVWTAVENKPKEGFRWIPVYEPSLVSYIAESVFYFRPSLMQDIKIQFMAGKKPFIGHTCLDWDRILNTYSPENESGMASKTTYFLLLLRWLKDGIYTSEQLEDTSEKIWNDEDLEDAKGGDETTGERGFGGLYGFVGNTRKIVKDSESKTGYSACGIFESLRSYQLQVANCYPIAEYLLTSWNCGSIGWLELKK